MEQYGHKMTNNNNLQSTTKPAILNLEQDHILRLTVGGRFVGQCDLLSGVIMLYHRGETKWYSIAEERRKAGLVIENEKA
jgi:hypothetical protein